MRKPRLLPSLLLLVLLAMTLQADAAAPDAPGENFIQIKNGPMTWLIRYASKDADGTLCGVEGRTADDSLTFTAAKCTFGKMAMTLSEGFRITRDSNETRSVGLETRAYLALDSYRFVIARGKAHTRIIQP